MFDERQYDVIQENSGVGAYTAKVFMWMFIGLLVTAAASYGLIVTGIGQLFWNSGVVFLAIAIIEIALVIYISGAIDRDMSPTRAKLAFVIYSMLNALTLSGFLYLYAELYGAMLIVKAFITTSLTFGVMGIYGYSTKKDLSGIGKILIMLLVGIIIATIVNAIFSFFGVYSATLDLAISYVAVVAFAGLTAWDTQRIRAIYYQAQGNDKFLDRIAINGALALYLDFINLFIYILKLFARNRD